LKVQLKRKVGDDVVSDRETVLARKAELVCPEISKGRIVLENFRDSEGLLVLRIARISRPKAIPAHFLLLSIVEGEDGLWVDSEPVMTLPGRKNNMLRDEQTVEGEDD
jgi:hypothetical protein